MSPHHAGPQLDRRRFLRWLSASPVCAAAAGSHLSWINTAQAQELPQASLHSGPASAQVASAKEALDVFDLATVAENTLPPAHWGYIKTGVDGESTQANNRAALERIYLRARRLVDVSNLDTRVSLFDREWPTPIMIAPAGSQRGFHSEGELATARAAQ